VATPTAAQIAQVQSNLTNMQALNDYVYNEGQAKVFNAYLLLSEPDTSDPGMDVVLNLLEGAFRGIGAMFGPIGAFVSGFVSGMVTDWADSPPPSLNTTFADLVSRLSATSVAVDQQLAVYYQDVAGNWDTSFTYNGKTTALSDLATIIFPAETDPDFEAMASAALVALDQTIWQTVLCANMVVTLWESGQPINLGGDQDDPPVSWDEMFIKQNPAYYNTWGWHNSEGCGDQSGWIINEYNLGTGAGVFKDGSISDDACTYLFKDSSDGVIINADGLFPRKTVFTGLGIKQTNDDVPSSGGPETSVSFGYLRAVKQGRSLSQLVEEKGARWVKKQLRQRASKDPIFRHNLSRRPRQTIENFFGVKIPEVLDLRVVVESGRTFGLVIPEGE